MQSVLFSAVSVECGSAHDDSDDRRAERLALRSDACRHEREHSVGCICGTFQGSACRGGRGGGWTIRCGGAGGRARQNRPRHSNGACSQRGRVVLAVASGDGSDSHGRVQGSVVVRRRFVAFGLDIRQSNGLDCHSDVRSSGEPFRAIRFLSSRTSSCAPGTTVPGAALCLLDLTDVGRSG